MPLFLKNNNLSGLYRDSCPKNNNLSGLYHDSCPKNNNLSGLYYDSSPKNNTFSGLYHDSSLGRGVGKLEEGMPPKVGLTLKHDIFTRKQLD